MKLYYFDINDTPDALKNKRNALIKKHHPDKVSEDQKATKTEIMKRINAEYEFLLKSNKQSKLKEPAPNKPPFSQESVRQAQDFYNALNTSNYLMLINSVVSVNNLEEVCKVFYHYYKIPLIAFLKKKLPPRPFKMILKLLPNP